MDEALDLLGPLEDHDPLRAALVMASTDDPERRWTGSERYLTLATRIVDVDRLEAEIPRLIEAEARRAERVWEQTLNALRAMKEGDPATAAGAFIAAGEIEENAGRLGPAESLYNRALELGRKPRDRRAEGLALRRLGRTAKAQGDLALAIDRYLSGFEIAEAERDTEGMIVACQGLGNCHVDAGRWEDADAWYRRGVGLLGNEHVRERWQLEVNLSIVARRSGRFEDSEAWLAAARKTSSRLGDDEGEVFLANAEGLLLAAKGALGDAELAYRKAAATAVTATGRATVLINLAECLLMQGRNAESFDLTRELESLAIAYRLEPYFLYAYLGLGAVARAEGDPDGLIFYEQALALAQQAGNPAEVALVQREYSRWEAGQGMTEAAAARLEAAVELFDRCGSKHDRDEARIELERLTGSQVEPGDDHENNSPPDEATQ